MYIVYKITGTFTNLAYYGYCEGETADDVKHHFLKGATRSDERKDVEWLENNNNDTDIKVSIIDVCNDEVDAWASRNDQRSNNIDSFTQPTIWPLNASQHFKDEGERSKKWKLKTSQLSAKTARQAYSMGLWNIAQIKELCLKHGKQVVVSDLDTMSPITFINKYFPQ